MGGKVKGAGRGGRAANVLLRYHIAAGSSTALLLVWAGCFQMTTLAYAARRVRVVVVTIIDRASSPRSTMRRPPS